MNFKDFYFPNLLWVIVFSFILASCHSENESPQITNASKYYLVPNSGNSSAVTTMVDLASGKSSFDDFDISMNGLTFSRKFNSQGLGLQELGGWQHNFGSYIGSKSINYKNWKGIKSSEFSNAEEACINGWSEIKNNAFHGKIKEASASFENGICDITLNNKSLAKLPIFSTNDNELETSLKVLNYQDGTYHFFYNEDNSWVNISGTNFELHEAANGWTIRTPTIISKIMIIMED